jgi:ParB family chromosome partitioning protein
MGRVKLGERDDELVVSAPDPARPRILPLHQLQPNPENPRPPEADIQETADSLRDHGQLQNINVMTLASFRAQKPHLASQLTPAPYVVINGCRRLAAAHRAGLAGLRYEQHDDWTENDIDEAVVTENEQRLDVNPLELGRHLARMLPRYRSHRALAAALNKGQPWVSQRIGLTTLHPDLQAAVATDTVAFTLARECTRLHDDLQPLLASGELPAEVARLWLMELRLKADEQLTRWQAGPPYLVEEHQDDNPVDQEGEQKELPVAREQRTGIVIRIADRSPSTLADVLRRRFTAEEIAELVHALTT